MYHVVYRVKYHVASHFDYLVFYMLVYTVYNIYVIRNVIHTKSIYFVSNTILTCIICRINRNYCQWYSAHTMWIQLGGVAIKLVYYYYYYYCYYYYYYYYYYYSSQCILIAQMVRGSHSKLPPPFVAVHRQCAILCTCIIIWVHGEQLCYVMLCYF